MTESLAQPPTRDGHVKENTPQSVEDAVLGADLPPASTLHGKANDLALAATRRIQVVSDALAGLTYEQIAERHGFSDKSAAHKAVMRSLQKVEARLVDEYRTLEAARLDQITLAMAPLMLDARQPGATRIAAAGKLLATSERRARLLGLDAPQRVDISAGTQAQLEDALIELRQVVLGEVTNVEPDPEAVSGG